MLAALRCPDELLRLVVLLGNEQRDVHLEAAGAKAYDDDRNDEARERGVQVLNHARHYGHDEEGMLGEHDTDGHTRSCAGPSLTCVCNPKDE